MQRLSSISEVTVAKNMKPSQRFEFIEGYLKDIDIHKIYLDTYSQHFEKVWNIAMGESATDILIHFHFAPEAYSKQLSRLKATRHHGIIEELGGGNIDYTVSVQNELELVPWIRSYGASAIVDKAINPSLAERLKDDWKEALKQYGAF